MSDATTVVRVRKETRARINAAKMVPGETTDSVINRAIDKLVSKPHDGTSRHGEPADGPKRRKSA